MLGPRRSAPVLPRKRSAGKDWLMLRSAQIRAEFAEEIVVRARFLS